MGPATVNQEDLLEEAGARVEAETGLEKVRGLGGTGREYWRGPAASMGAELIREVGDTHNGGGAPRLGSGVFYSARVSSVAQRLETRPCWSNN